MKLIIIRHADPDYTIDSLTEKGWKEAELLSDRVSKMDVKAFYVSPLGRAKDTASVTQSANVKKEADAVCSGLDELLKEHGYQHEGNLFRAIRPNNDTVILFCHFGVECIILGHLLGISPMVLWHGFCAAPSSVTTLITEERREGTAYFRMSSFGDISHLYAFGEPPAFAARFCETYENMDERHD